MIQNKKGLLRLMCAYKVLAGKYMDNENAIRFWSKAKPRKRGIGTDVDEIETNVIELFDFIFDKDKVVHLFKEH